MNSRRILSLNSRVRNKIITNSRKTSEAQFESFVVIAAALFYCESCIGFFIIFKYTSMMQVKVGSCESQGNKSFEKTLSYMLHLYSKFVFLSLIIP